MFQTLQPQGLSWEVPRFDEFFWGGRELCSSTRSTAKGMGLQHKDAVVIVLLLHGHYCKLRNM